MAYSLERLNVLVVEDNPFVNKLVCDVLAALGAGRTLASPDGADAVERLSNIRTAPQRAGASQIDLVIADIVMPNVNGIELLKWIRTSANSPNRFMPIIMLSAAADRANVESARDHGANEFVVKPFTVDKVTSRLLAVIDQPRDYIYCQTYFGPDRRRLDVGPPDAERRETQEQDVRLVYSEQAPEVIGQQGQKGQQVLRYSLPNALRGRVGGVPGRRGSLEPQSLLDAERVIAEKADEYGGLLGDIIKELAAALANCGHVPGEEEVADAQAQNGFAQLNQIAMELRGQGHMFGFPLITMAATSLYEYTVAQAYVDEDHLELVKAHVDFLANVVRDEITGDGGEIGRKLLSSLNRARQHYRQRNAA